MSNRKVGIVLLNFNGSEFLRYTLESLLRAKTKVAFEAGVIDNGSEVKDAAAAQKYFEAYRKNGGKGFFIRSEKNLGFSGGNNVVIKRFLEDPEITHICFLNSDVLVTDHWLEYLTDNDYDVTGPVTNATGSEQTVAVDYEVQPNADAYETVNRFSYYRHEVFGDLVFETDILYFFNTMFTRRVIEKIGLLDERFYPGSFEDIDYCLRIKQAGFKQMVIRGCFVHHFGSGSFSKLDMPDRVNISNVNRKRFEEKWNTQWEGDSWRLLQSCRQDLSRFNDLPIDDRTNMLISKTIQAAETLIKNWSAGINWYQSEQYADSIIRQYEQIKASKAQMAPADGNAAQSTGEISPVYSLRNGVTYVQSIHGKDLLYLLVKKVQLKCYQLLHMPQEQKLRDKAYVFPQYPHPTLPLGLMSGKEIIKRIIKLARIKLGLKQDKKIHIALENGNITTEAKGALQEQYPVIAQIMEKLAQTDKKVAIHAPIFTPENERDGYIQRIKRVDEEIFDGYLRVYFLEDGKKGDRLGEEVIDDQHYFITYNSHDPEQRKIVSAIAELCGLLYIHSINRFMTDSVNVEMCQLLNNDKIKTIWDVHGSVPEEYLMYGSETGKKIGDELESYFYHHIDVIVVVNNAMKRHLMRKHGDCNARFVVLPIFNIDVTKQYDSSDLSDHRSKDRATIVYAGGTQKWQNVELMQAIMDSTSDKYDFKMFVPDPAEFNAMWKNRKAQNVTVDSKSPEELALEYMGCDYGFVLRDPIVVNQVACPTKIIEYIQYGIVPIMKTAEIGDFLELGMEYIDYQMCMDGNLPTEEARKEMAEKNYSILHKLQDSYKTGISSLREEITAE